jgi:Flp pilus assembly protein CpaB
VKRSNRLVILVGVLLAVLAFVAIVILLNQRQGPGEVPPEEVLATVLVATEDIDIGEEVTPAKVEEREIDPEAVQGTPLASTTAVAGQPALFAVPEGSQVSGEVIGLGNDLAVCLPCQLEPGEKAIALQVDRVTGLDFLVTPGNTIDIVLTEQITVLQETEDSAANTDPEAAERFEPVTGLTDQRTVKAILQDKRVLYVSATRAQQQEPQDTNGDGVVDENDVQPDAPVIDAVIIVFAGTTQDAEVIKFAQNDVTERGSLGVIVRNADDDALDNTTGVTIDVLVSDYGLRLPDIVQQLNEEAAP